MLAGCGGDEPKTEEGAEEAVEAYTEAFVDGDDDACDLLTDDYREELVEGWNEDGFGDEEAEDCDDVIEQGAIFAEAFGADELEIEEFDTELDGDRATVVVTYDDSEFGPETYTLVYEDGDWLIDGEGEVDEDDADDETLDEGSESAEAEPTETTTPVAPPLSLGESGVVGDWEVSVTEVDDDATALLTKPRFYNEAPLADYVLVTFEATYVGPERSAYVESDLTWTLTGTDQQVHEESDATSVADDESWPTEARPGGTVTGQAVFDLDPAQLADALVSAESYTDDGDEVYVDFAL